MPPKAHLEPHLSPDALKDCYRQSKDAVEARRWHLLYLVSSGWTIKKASGAIALSYDYSKEIVRRYNRQGPTAIARRNHPGRSSPRALLTKEQQEELAKLLKSRAPDGQPWSGPKVAAWIAKRTGRSQVWPQRGWEYLRRLGPQNGQA
ncbi:MAG: helix-turn-helix domain-containing protein [Cyanobacteria bacterium P01_D01_bin.73]